ncbi:MAG: transcription repressor NadR [Dethiobacteria bacterium]|jgi:transcriptional regulator of NAD metabolism
METEKRRSKLLRILHQAKGPVTGMELGLSLGVSRQVIVQDIAILRASGEQVLATPQGYLSSSLLQENTRRVVACQHTKEQIAEELGIIVDLGGKALDVIIEHPVYGELRGNLMIACRRDLCLFLQQLEKTAAHPLSMLTYGVHLHTLEAADEQNMDEIVGALEKAGFLTK